MARLRHEQMRRREGKGLSEVVNDLIRRAVRQAAPEARRFVQRRSELGRPRLPVDDVAGLLDALEGPDHRS